MAKNTSKKAKAASGDKDKVVRIKASAPAKKSAKTEKTEKTAVTTVVKATKTEKTTKPVAAKETAKADKSTKKKSGNGIRGAGILSGIGGYFKGAWVELRQVRWPNRRATWSLTGAVLVYSLFFVLLILLLDGAFKYLFNLILGN